LYAYSSPLNSKEAVLISEDMVVLVSNKLKQERTQSGLKVLYPNEPTEITSGDESYYITVPGGTYIRTDSRGCTSVFFPDYKSGLKIFPSSDPAVCYMPPLQGNCSEGSGQIYRIPIPILVRDYNFIPSFLHCDKVSESHPVPDTVYVEEFWAIDDEHEYGFGLFFLDTTSSYYYAIAANSQQIDAVLNSFNKR
jgi:hypothetical protein